MNNKKKSSPFLWYMVIPSILFVLIVTGLNIFLYNQELGFYKNIYNNEIAGTQSMINRRFQSAMVAAETIRAYFLGSQTVTKEEFDQFGEVLTKNIASGSIAMPVTAEWVDEKNNIQYVYPMNADNAKIVGLDLNKYPNRLLPITKAKETRSPVITEPIMLGQGYPGLLLYSPIYKGEEYLGQSVVVIRLANLLAPIPGSTPIYNKDEYIQTDKFIIPFDDDMIFNKNGERIINPAGDLKKDPISQEYSASIKGVVSEKIIFADKTWQLKFSPTYTQAIYKRVSAYVGLSLILEIIFISFLWTLHRGKQKILLEKARTDALMQSVGDGLMAVDGNGVITYANKKAEDLSGYNAKEAVGKSYLDFWKLVDDKGNVVPQKERPFHKAIIKKELINIPLSDHLYLLKKDGTRFPFSSTIAPVVVGGQVSGSIMSFRDITKESEVDRMKTEFLSLASHQLLTPSSAIKWTCELLLGGDYGKMTSKQISSIQNIYSSNESMISLVNSLLNVSRIEAGRIIIDPKPTNLRELADSMIEEVNNKIVAKNQTLTIVSDKNLPKINIDPKLIREVYKNLLTNAIKYTPEGGKISVNIDIKGEEIVSKVRDNGYGILEKDKNKVFQKFYRGENIVRIEKDGNGLGLYLIKQIVDVSGGKIGFESKENEGTTFWFSLPLAGSKPKAGEVSVS
jgi:PAS domain S-box-containing protein